LVGRIPSETFEAMSAERFSGAPDRIARLPSDRRGYPVPWFVAWRDGEPDFRVVSAPRLAEAWEGERCWICGGKLGAYRAWVIGPMCVLERACPEPPSHLECGEFAARHCPFLSNPKMRRREPSQHAHHRPTPNTVELNTETTAIWVTKARGAKPFRAGGGVLFGLSDPVRLDWYAHGRPATTAEVRAGLARGLPLLRDTAEAEGSAAVAELDRRIAWVERWIPDRD
jgi:hypothetical protein